MKSGEGFIVGIDRVWAPARGCEEHAGARCSAVFTSPFDLITLRAAKRTRGAVRHDGGRKPPRGEKLQRARERLPPDAEDNISDGVLAAAAAVSAVNRCLRLFGINYPR